MCLEEIGITRQNLRKEENNFENLTGKKQTRRGKTGGHACREKIPAQLLYHSSFYEIPGGLQGAWEKHHLNNMAPVLNIYENLLPLVSVREGMTAVPVAQKHGQAV